jgi:hypothetical protein
MRFDKDIWNPNCQEYQPAVDPGAVGFITPTARVFISLWLELLNDDRAPATCILGHLALPSLLLELRRACELWLENERRFHRFRAAARLLVRATKLLDLEFAGRRAVRRLADDASALLDLIEALDQKKKADLEKAMRQKLGLAQKDDVQKVASIRLFQSIVGCLAQLRGGSDYKDSVRRHIQDRLADANTTAEAFLSSCSHSVGELLSLVLDRGNSRESLAELPIKYLRADHIAHSGTSLADRINLLFGAFHSEPQSYVVYLPITGTEIDIQGDIFPPGLTLVDSAAWAAKRAEFSDVQNSGAIDGPVRAICVDLNQYLAANLDADESAPLDVFAARDVAVRASQLCLDAIFLYREHHVRLARACAVEVGTAPQIEHRCVLFHRQDFLQRAQVRLRFLRPVPTAWSDALHWYRLGKTTPKDESGIVNLWTAAELVAASSNVLHGTDIDRVRRSVGAASTIFVFYEEFLYCALAARTYAQKYNRLVQMAPPAMNSEEKDLLNWWCDLCGGHDSVQLYGSVFDEFPHLAYYACRTKRLQIQGAGNVYQSHKEAIIDNLSWIYGCRNDIVHDGRVRVPGAAVARGLIAKYVGITLESTLSMRAHGNVEHLSECFPLVWEKERSLVECLEQGDLKGALNVPYQ